MSPTKRRALVIAVRSSLLAAVLFVSPIPIVRLGMHQVEKRIAGGDLEGAERLLSFFGAFSNYPLLPQVLEARIHGVRCELSARKGLDRDAMEHFVKELSILAGREPGPDGITQLQPDEAGASVLRFRKGFAAWSRGYAGWIESSPDVLPEFDRAFLAGITARGDEGEHVASSSGSDGSVRELFRRAGRGEGRDDIIGFLAAHGAELTKARRLSDGSGPIGGGLAGIGEAADHFRILVLDFIRSCQTHDEAAVSTAFVRCGRVLRRIESEPSMVALLVVIGLRSQWMEVMETLVDGDALSFPTRQGLVHEWPLCRSNPEFPPLCFRFEYASFRKIYVDSYLGGDWETASPAGRRLFTRQLEMAFARQEALAASVAPDADAAASRKVFASLQEAGNLSPKILELRQRFSKTIYGTNVLGEEDGRDFAKAIDEWIVTINDAVATPRLGRLDDALKELREREEHLLRRLKSSP